MNTLAKRFLSHESQNLKLCLSIALICSFSSIPRSFCTSGRMSAVDMLYFKVEIKWFARLALIWLFSNIFFSETFIIIYATHLKCFYLRSPNFKAGFKLLSSLWIVVIQPFSIFSVISRGFYTLYRTVSEFSPVSNSSLP